MAEGSPHHKTTRTPQMHKVSHNQSQAQVKEGARLVTVTFIDLTNCDEDDFASDLPIEIIDLSKPPITVIDLTE